MNPDLLIEQLLKTLTQKIPESDYVIVHDLCCPQVEVPTEDDPLQFGQQTTYAGTLGGCLLP